MAFKSQLAHTSLQVGRDTVAEVKESAHPWREGALEAYRRRNASLDALFYDVGKITPTEASSIAPWMAHEGALLIVPPSGNEPLKLCTSITDFKNNGGSKVRTLAVAGVGSSALGSAAFARNVADALNEPVAALVSGYGLADLAAEASGGWFWFGALNSVRNQFEVLDETFRTTRNYDERAITLASPSPQNLARRSLDTRVLVSLLSDSDLKFNLLTGHSKGNYVISEALYSLDAEAAKRLDAKTNIVTVSATISMPRHYQKVIDVIGQWDWFGRLNSRPSLQAERKPLHAWHHTNTELLWHLPVTDVFKELLTSGELVLKPH